jgi:hypothetical protein
MMQHHQRMEWHSLLLCSLETDDSIQQQQQPVGKSFLLSRLQGTTHSSSFADQLSIKKKNIRERKGDPVVLLEWGEDCCQRVVVIMVVAAVDHYRRQDLFHKK